MLHWFDELEITDDPGMKVVYDNLRLPNATRASIFRVGVQWYFTAGNLFGSQTVECIGPETVLAVLVRCLNRDEDSPSLDLPPWARLMEPAAEAVQKRRRAATDEF